MTPFKKNPTHTYSYTGNFTVKLVVTNSNGCTDSTTRSFSVNISPTISIPGNYSICRGDSVQLNLLGAQTYQWYPPQGLSCLNCPNPMAAPVSNTTYNITVFSNLGCIANAVINITVKQPIQINVSPNRATCGRATTNLLAAGASSYTWSPAAGLSNTAIPNPIASPDTTTTYMVVGNDANNCFNDTGYVKLTVYPIPSIELGPDVTLTTGTIYPLQPQTTNGPIVSWLWTPAINLNCTTCPYPLATVKFDITYRALVKNIYGCAATDSIRIHTLCKGSQVFIPNAFTPDGDGKNDILVVRSSGIDAIRSFKIYSRWGELLFEKYNFPPNNPAYGWDGKIKGKSGSAEVYVYILEVTCDNNEHLAFKGNISILN